MRLIVAAIALTISTSGFTQEANPWITQLMARDASHALMQSMSLQRMDGKSWATILEHHLPNQIDENCGYRERAGFGDNLTPAILGATKRTLARALVRAYEKPFDRPGAQIHLFDEKILSENEVMISLRVVPGYQHDPWFNLFYRMGKDGAVHLCDIGADDNGGLREISEVLSNQE